MERTKDPLDLPFLDYLAIFEIFGGVISKRKIYDMMHALLAERDDNGNLLIDPNRMPDTGKILVPTEIFCKRYQIKRNKKRHSST